MWDLIVSVPDHCLSFYFNFSRPTRWTDWKERFSRFRQGSKLDKEDEEVQISSLNYKMRREAENVFKSFQLNVDNAKKFSKVVEKLDAHFIPKRTLSMKEPNFTSEAKSMENL